MKVALVYDRINKLGGAEKVLLALHHIWPDAPLYTSVYDKKLTPWADVFDVRTSFLQKLPLPKNKHEYYPFLMGLAFESFNFDEYDVVISVTAEFCKAIITKPQTLHVCYCLNPTSYLWSGYDQYYSGKPGWFRAITTPMINYLRWYDKIIAERPDRYITITKTVQDRLKRYYGRDSDIIYPPVDIKERPFEKASTGNFFLIVSRLAPQKRLDVAIKAFNKLGWPLKVIGSGIEETKLKSLAKNNIEFLGFITDDQLSHYYANCQAVIIPGEEDFNIVSVEAQSYGKPVVAYGRGGVTETVLEGKTGWFFPEQTPEVLVATLQKTKFARIDPKDCQHFSGSP